MPRRPVFAVALAALVLCAPAVTAQTTVRDSVRMDIKIYTYRYQDGPNNSYYNCGSGLYAIWPDVLADILTRPTRYSDYTLVATQGEYVPRGFQETLSNPQLGISVPPDYYGHLPQLGSGAQSGGSYSSECPRYYAGALYLASGGPTGLNAAPFRISQWYAVYSVPDGEPIALFDWTQTTGLSVAFDASFASGQSREIDVSVPGGKRAVASYAWDFGDGASGASAKPSHTYAQDGTYTVTLTVTDDDGETDSYTQAVAVQAYRLQVGAKFLGGTAGVVSTPQYEGSAQRVTLNDELTFVATLENVGTEPVANVTLAPDLSLAAIFPDSLDGALRSNPVIDPVDAAAQPAMRASLAPGDTVEVTRRYVVTRPGQYRWVATEPWRDVPVEIAAFPYWASGEDDQGEAVDIERPPPQSREATTVFPVDAEGAPDSPWAVSVLGNPSAQPVVRIEGAVAPLRVTVLDVLGRQVALLHDGPPRGRMDLSVPRLPVGSYLVRIDGAEGIAVARVTVVR